ncbi:MAG: Fe-Mn family superoxide dismutase [Planctomycetota bacterium]
MNRRDVLTSLTLGGAAMALPDLRTDGRWPSGPQKPGAHEIVPLPFDPTKLRGLSEKLMVSHHDNNYAGAVKNLNKVEAELANVTKDTPGFVVAGLAERELLFRSSSALHERYFANLGGDGKLAGALAEALTSAFGSMARFEERFRATAMSLAGGSGWVVLGHDLHRDGLVISWSGGHTQNLAASLPLLVLDMYEHSYQLDYGAAAAKYVDAFFANIHAEEVGRRHAAARRAAAALRG